MIEKRGVELAVERYQQYRAAGCHALMKSREAIHGGWRGRGPLSLPPRDVESVHASRSLGDPLRIFGHYANEQAVAHAPVEIGIHDSEVDRLVIAGNEPCGLDVQMREQPLVRR